jgi:hypothetical protein
MSIQAARSKLLELLKEQQIVTAKHARDSGVQSPAARARELAEHGYRVVPCWQLLKRQKPKSLAGTRLGKSQKSAIKPNKNSKPASKKIAAKLKRGAA